ncbi:acetylornithine deacetylase or succinyl-diaminopimelate desuccinylase [Marinitoga piezophila KA3]|uniref:Acetylornithine deacetylase or succinyl-diaminopimelate desuccinylase n=1 Tax=Marinitoga piezophila (strain DSM 14283 / JCM 11233 / KA3) TaxID=443254 RepID=H2J7M7_MARPK|nr:MULTISPECIES: M20 family metallo-hydrolase [Marinitoga]AEX85368.1 acetylornithine deacetylase or succinyl-diaminopimelate desuccinylase [Marinitoga piezophila KA3]APT75846.1 diaminopimelate aminotransferase [Marinitoga sp. 1137]NUU97501.1 diaminopimelate aminotransferase [Marinitoga sp. 1138]
MKEKILEHVEKNKDEIIETSKRFISINSVNPRAGGPGEKEVAEWLESYLKTMKFDEIKRYDAPDDIVEYGFRPNIVAIYKGTSPERTIWFITHMDKVPEGDLSLWDHDPFDPVIKDGKIYGRGAEDNGSSLVATLHGLKTLMDLNIRPKNNIALVFVSDEETGSDYGIKYLVKQGIFDKNDWYYVPDSGNPEGSFIEIAEKSILWLKIVTEGKQAHASAPTVAKNAHRAAIYFAKELDEFLHEKYVAKDPLFNIPFSTFEPTKKEHNVDNINTIPGTDIMYFDCRILPQYDLNEILADVENIKKKYEEKFGVKIHIETPQMEKAPDPTPADHPSVLKLKEAIKELRNIDATVGGIGGGTCAAILREAGLPALVWGTMDHTAHQPNEYIKIEHLIADTKIYAYLMANF